MFRWWIAATSCLLALWALGGWWTLRRAEARLEAAAAGLLEDERFQGLDVSFRGPVAVLSGRASSVNALAGAERRLREELRLDGSNPVLGLTSTASAAEDQPSLGEDAGESGEAGRSVPQSWVVLFASSGQVTLAGVLSDVSLSVALKREVDRVWQGYQVSNSLRVDGEVKPFKVLRETLKNLPRPDPDQDGMLTTTTGEGAWMRLPLNGDELTVAQALSGTEARLPEIAQVVAAWRALRKNADRPGRVMQGPKAGAPAVPQTTGRVSRARAVGPPYLGWARHESEVWLFGAVTSEERRAKLLEQAERAFQGLTLHVQGLMTDPSRVEDSRSPLTLPPKAVGVTFAVLVAGKPVVSYPPDVTEGRLAADFRAVGINEMEVGEALIPFREKLVADGGVKLMESYLSLVSDGRVVLLSGETASLSMKQALLEALQPLVGSMALVHEGLRVSPLVAPASEMLLALRQAAQLEPGRRLVLALRPRQVARRGVLHTFAATAGEGVDVETARAVRTMRKVLDVDGEALFEIVGHTDGAGDAQKDSAESLKRAEEVKARLVDAGFDGLRLAVRGAGTAEPIAENVTENGRALNRRVDIRWLQMDFPTERTK